MKGRINKLKREVLIRYAYLKKMTTLPYLPAFVAIEPTNYCNYKCLMCPQSSEKSDSILRGFMSDDVFNKVIDEIKTYAFEVFIQLGGEPLLHNKLIDFIKQAKNQGLITGISTNASLLDRDFAKRIISSGLDKLFITFTDKGKERYDKIWQGGVYENVKKNIIEFLNSKKGQQNPRVTLQIVKFFGEDDVLTPDKVFLEEWKRRGVDSFSPVWATYWAGDFKDEAMFRYKEAPRDDYYRPCGAIWRSLVVYWDGSISPCCNDLTRNYILGNIKENSIRELWNGEKMAGLREALVKKRYKEIKLCRNCLALWGRLPAEKKKWWAALENRIRKIGQNFSCFRKHN